MSSVEQNQDFRLLLADAPRELLSTLGEALLCLEQQRSGESEAAPAQLRSAWLGLARHFVTCGRELNPQQQLFLLSGAIASYVLLKNPAGETLRIELLPEELYRHMLASLEAWRQLPWRPDYILEPMARIEAAGTGLLKPYDPLKPGRYRPPSPQSIPQSEPQLREQTRRALARSRVGMDDTLKRFAGALSAERIAPLLRSVKELSSLSQQVLDGGPMPSAQRLRDLSVGARLRQLGRSVDDAALALSRSEEELLAGLSAMQSQARAVASPSSPGAAARSLGGNFDASLAERDLLRMHELQGAHEKADHKPNPWHQARILTSEHFSDIEGDWRGCLALPGAVLQAIRRIDRLHPNLFPHDSEGQPLLPPLVLEASAGQLRWLDDRFVVSFLCTEPPRQGPLESFTALEATLLRLYGQFLASGDIFNYRGEKAKDSFIADYSVAEENKAVVRFVGADKRMTYGSSTEVKDSASREDAERDYADFIFTAINNLPLPRRVNPRRVGVLLRYCLVRDSVLSAQIVMRHIAQSDQLLAKDLLTRLGGRNELRIAQLVQAALEADSQIAAQYRRDPLQALEHVMGREFVKELRAATAAPATESAADPVSAGGQTPASHDYFEL